jgi:hypothetical protein
MVVASYPNVIGGDTGTLLGLLTRTTRIIS